MVSDFDHFGAFSNPLPSYHLRWAGIAQVVHRCFASLLGYLWGRCLLPGLPCPSKMSCKGTCIKVCSLAQKGCCVAVKPIQLLHCIRCHPCFDVWHAWLGVSLMPLTAVGSASTWWLCRSHHVFNPPIVAVPCLKNESGQMSGALGLHA